MALWVTYTFLKTLSTRLNSEFLTDKQNFKGTYTIAWINNFEETFSFKKDNLARKQLLLNMHFSDQNYILL